MSEPQIIRHAFRLEQVPRRVLLFAPPLYDVRFPWSEWQQPAGLLQLATALRRMGCDLRLVDALSSSPGGALPRRLVRKFTRGEYSVNYWRWGQPTKALQKSLDDLKQEGWYPEDIYLLSGLACQWQGSHEAISLARQVFPAARFVLYGDYPTLATEHALATSGADVLIEGPIQELVGLPLDLSLYTMRPRIAHLCIGSAERPVADLLDEFLVRVAPASRKARIGHVVLADPDAFRRFPVHIRALCQAVLERNLSISLHAFGGVHPSVLTEDPDLAALLLRTGFKQLIFTDDRAIPFAPDDWEIYLNELNEAIARCCEAGYRLRTDALVASACLGRPQENLIQVVGRVAELAHVAGSIILLPYQPIPVESPTGLPLEEANGRLYQFAEANGCSYKDYLDVIGLAAILNSKYRTKTFDFLGDSLTARLVRQSLVTESWRPPATPDQPVTVGYFGKGGKWVKRPL